VIIFPELSLTGYEPGLAKALATIQDDRLFDVFQKIFDSGKIIIGVGIPINTDGQICISMVIFHPFRAKQIYSKKYLHPDEEPFFVPGQNSSNLIEGKTRIALAICYELSIPGHVEAAVTNKAEIYIASVAKSVNGVEKAVNRLSEIAGKYSIPVLMSNCIGNCDGFESAGRTSVWYNNGELACQLDGTNEGILIFDTNTQELMKTYC
jgi:predicted amidohydrolase